MLQNSDSIALVDVDEILYNLSWSLKKSHDNFLLECLIGLISAKLSSVLKSKWLLSRGRSGNVLTHFIATIQLYCDADAPLLGLKVDTWQFIIAWVLEPEIGCHNYVISRPPTRMKIDSENPIILHLYKNVLNAIHVHFILLHKYLLIEFCV